MKKYDKLIEDTTVKIESLKKGNKGHTAGTTQSNLNALQKAIKKGDEKAAEAAAEKLSEMKKVEVNMVVNGEELARVADEQSKKKRSRL